jgi:hypothetical protein
MEGEEDAVFESENAGDMGLRIRDCENISMHPNAAEDGYEPI